MAYNKHTHLEDNIAAIRLAFHLQKENRNPSDQEKETLAKYSGFGGLKCILWDTDRLDKENIPAADLSLVPLVEELHR